MSASLPKNHSTFSCCLQESNARLSALVLLAVLLATATASAQQRRIQLDDLEKVVTVSDPQISPEGKVHRLRGVATESRGGSLRKRTGAGGGSDRHPESADH
jgi:hypothetical protein